MLRRFTLPIVAAAILAAIAMIVLVGGWAGLGVAGGLIALAIGLTMWSDGPHHSD